MPNPETTLPVRDKLVSLAGAFALFDRHLQVEQWYFPFLYL
jgi:hypothetical protein